MKPIIFPFTFLSEPQLRQLGTFFDKAVMYRPAAEQAPEGTGQVSEQGLLEIITPVKGDESTLSRLLEEYRIWLDRHKGSEMTFFKTRLFDSFNMDNVPYFSSDSTSRIKADIKTMDQGEAEPPPQGPDPLFAARFFLWVAQSFDMQHHEINRDLAVFKDMEKALFSEMHGEEDFSETTGSANIDSVITDDPGQYKTVQRLSAWLKLFEQEPVGPDESGTGLFLTTSRVVLDHVLEMAGNAVRVLALGPVAVAGPEEGQAGGLKSRLAEYLAALKNDPGEIKTPEVPELQKSAFPTALLEIYAIEGKSPRELFRGANSKGPIQLDEKQTQNFTRIFVGFIG